MKKLLAMTIFAVLASSTTVAIAHSGGTDAYGCHYDRKTGIKHCH